MQGTVIEVAIAMILVYLVFALLASGVQELVAGWFELRGRRLRAALAYMLGAGSHESQAPTGLFDKVFGHALVGGLLPRGLPSYVPARNISRALLDALLDGSEGTAFSRCEAAVARMPAGRTRDALTSFVVHAEGDVSKLQASIETWYDDTMDRVSGAYKRFSHYCLLGLGLLIAAVLNVDSFRIAYNLWTNGPLRADLVAMADRTAKDSQGGSIAGADASTRVVQASDTLASLTLPIGWNKVGAQFDGSNAIWAVVGWCITAFAIALGAPFWFDLLGGAMKLRNAGERPSRSDAN